MINFIDIKTVLLIFHIFGAILGAGGAFVSDAIFFKTIRDGIIEDSELSFMKLGSKLVWLGVLILIISGIFLFYTNPTGYLASSKFLAKVTIVGIIIINGIIFHFVHIPHIYRHTGLKINESESFMKKFSFLLVSGAVSIVSWVSTVILGMLKVVPYSYIQIIGFYFVLVFVAISFALLGKKMILGTK